MKTSILVLFGLSALAQWMVPLVAIRQHERVLTEGTLIKLKCSAPDPYDPLRGRFLAVRPTLNTATGDAPHGQSVYVSLKVAADGFAAPQALTLNPPSSGLYVRVKSQYGSHFEWPFDRFYLNEQLAPEADKWFAENIRSAKGIVAEVRVLEGRAVLADLSVDGKPMREMLKERVR